MLNSLELEILKRIKYGLSLIDLSADEEEMLNFLNSLKNRNILQFNEFDINKPELIRITQKGERLYKESVYVPSYL